MTLGDSYAQAEKLAETMTDAHNTGMKLHELSSGKRAQVYATLAVAEQLARIADVLMNMDERKSL